MDIDELVLSAQRQYDEAMQFRMESLALLERIRERERAEREAFLIRYLERIPKSEMGWCDV